MKSYVFIRWVLSVAGLLLSIIGFTQTATYKLSCTSYVQRYKDIAVKEMLTTGIPASITLAQGMLESNMGNSTLALTANNHFGIKCHAGWTGESFIQDDDARDECFRRYKNAEESFIDHSEFLKTRQRYAFLFELNTTDYKGWAYGLSKAGYATDKSYASRLIKIIDDNQLHQFDTETTKNIGSEKDRNRSKQTSINTTTPNRTATLRQVLLNNDVKYIVVQNGDTYYKIANDMDMRIWQLHRYNETLEQDLLHAGDLIYLQPKRNHSRSEKYHIAQQGETLYKISQHYGIKLKKLYKFNQIPDGKNPQAGQKIYLRKQRGTKIKIAEHKKLSSDSLLV